MGYGTTTSYLKLTLSFLVSISSWTRINKTMVKLSNTDKPLPERVRLLLEGMKLVNELDWDKPYIVSPSWINHASRIKRRARTDNGREENLMRHIQKFISQARKL
jgi:hypothetical protein